MHYGLVSFKEILYLHSDAHCRKLKIQFSFLWEVSFLDCNLGLMKRISIVIMPFVYI